jgi:hypothetical protein
LHALRTLWIRHSWSVRIECDDRDERSIDSQADTIYLRSNSRLEELANILCLG